jgi:hypothetical protein
VPLYLSNWSAETFGAWLLLQAVWSVITAFDTSHHDYVGYECLRLGADSRSKIADAVSSAAPIAFMIALWDIFLSWILGQSPVLLDRISGGGEVARQWHNALMLFAGTWLITRSQAGL